MIVRNFWDSEYERETAENRRKQRRRFPAKSTEPFCQKITYVERDFGHHGNRKNGLQNLIGQVH